MWTLLKKETLENLITMRFIIGFLACNLVFGLITYVLMQDFQLEMNRVEAAKQQNDDYMSRRRVWSQLRPTVVKTPSQLAVYGSNMGTQWGMRVWISHTRIPVLTTDETGDAGSTDLLGFLYEFDFNQIAQILISLIALLLSFDAISGEKERGTLRQVLSNSHKRTTVFVAKFLGALLPLVVIVLSSFIVSLSIYLMMSPWALTPDGWLSIGLIVLTSIFFGIIFVAVGLLVSAFTRKTSTSLIACMLVWILAVIVLPSSVGFISTTFGFRDDLVALQRSLTDLDNEYVPKMRLRVPSQDYTYYANVAIGDQGEAYYSVMGENYVRMHRELQPAAIAAQFEYAVKRYDIESGFHDQRARKLALTQDLLKLSPVSVYADILNALTRVDSANHEHFMAQARLYREQIISFIRGNGGYESKRWFTHDREDASYREAVRRMETLTQEEKAHVQDEDPDIYVKVQSWIQESMDHPEAALNLNGMPRFEFRPLALDEVVASIWLDFFLLAAIFAVVMVASYIRFLSYDPR